MVASIISPIFHNVRPARSIVVAASSVHRAALYTARVDPDDLVFPESEPEFELDGEVPEPEEVPVPEPELLPDTSTWPDTSIKGGEGGGSDHDEPFLA
jgi:hypothetical protein